MTQEVTNHLRKERKDGEGEVAVPPRSTCATPKLTREEKRAVRKRKRSTLDMIENWNSLMVSQAVKQPWRISRPTRAAVD